MDRRTFVKAASAMMAGSLLPAVARAREVARHRYSIQIDGRPMQMSVEPRVEVGGRVYTLPDGAVMASWYTGPNMDRAIVHIDDMHRLAGYHELTLEQIGSAYKLTVLPCEGGSVIAVLRSAA